MRIETKYSLGDKVWKISQNKPKTWIPCSFCGRSESYRGEYADSTKAIGLDGSEKRCPDCYGRGGRHEYLDLEWMVVAELTIGRVEYQTSSGETKESYMAKETGIGSGSVHYVDTLYPSKEEAKAECKRRDEAT